MHRFAVRVDGMAGQLRKRWNLATDLTLDSSSFRGQYPRDALPPPDPYEPGEWIEVVVSEVPRRVWRVLCLWAELPAR